MRDVLRTALCGLLEIEYPIVQSGMGAVAGRSSWPRCARAGGLGILAALEQRPVESCARGSARCARSRIALRGESLAAPRHPAARGPARLPEATGAGRCRRPLNRFRAELGASAVRPTPAAVPAALDAVIEVILEERVLRSGASASATPAPPWSAAATSGTSRSSPWSPPWTTRGRWPPRAWTWWWRRAARRAATAPRG